MSLPAVLTRRIFYGTPHRVMNPFKNPSGPGVFSDSIFEVDAKSLSNFEDQLRHKTLRLQLKSTLLEITRFLNYHQ